MNIKKNTTRLLRQSNYETFREYEEALAEARMTAELERRVAEKGMKSKRGWEKWWKL